MSVTITHPGCKTVYRTELGKILLSEERTVPEIIEYFANQYYIYGPDRCHFEAAWTRSLREAVERDYNRCEPTWFYQYFATKHVLNQVFDHISEITSYAVEERKMVDIICEMCKNAYELKQKTDFKNALAGKEKVRDW